MSDDGVLLKMWVLVGGVLMLVMGGLAALDTPLVGMPPDAWLSMNAMHGGVHALGAVFALGVALFLRGNVRAAGILAYGLIFVFAFVSNALGPDFFGMMPDAPANLPVHVMHATVAAVSLAAGYAAHT